MKNILHCLLVAFSCLAIGRNDAFGQPTSGPPSAATATDGQVPLEKFANALPPDAKKKVNELVNSPDTFNGALKGLVNPMFGGGADSKSFFGLLTNLHIHLKAFEPLRAGDEVTLGFDYSYDRAIMSHSLKTNQNSSTDLSFKFHANGNVAFDQDRNPDDFLETGLSLHLFHRRGGVNPMVYTNKELFDLNRQLVIGAASRKESGEDLDNTPEWRAWDAAVQRALRTQYLLDVAARFSLESNQDFSSRQYAYGLAASALVRGWNSDSPWARFNFFDYPFAMIRYLTGAERNKAFTPSGQAIPSIILGLDMVDPFDNDARLAVDPDKDPYPRCRVDVGMKTRVARLMQKDVWFEASYRYFVEVDPSTAIRQADLDEFHYFAASLEFMNGLSVTYSTGKLPMDARNDQVIALGWKFNF